MSGCGAEVGVKGGQAVAGAGRAGLGWNEEGGLALGMYGGGG